MKLIPLVNKKKEIIAVAKVSDDDFEAIKKLSWYINKKCKTGYAMSELNGKHILMHRLVMSAIDSNLVIDHIDGDGLNNQRENLRECTRSQNQANRTSYKNKYLGIFKVRNKWKAVLRKGEKRYKSKICETEEQAALEYNKLAIMHHGEFANLNIIEEGSHVNK